MEFNLLTLIGISLALMFFGYFFGLVEGRGQGAKKRRDEEELNNRSNVVFDKPLPPPSPLVTPVESNLLALSLDKSNQPQLKLDGQRLEADKLSPQNRKRLIDLMVMMRPWIEASPGQKQVASPQPAPRPVITEPAPTVIKQTSTKVSIPTAAPVVPAPEPAPTSMVVQIDAILQTRLIGTPLQDMGIRLAESARGDPVVIVGDKSYTGVAEVTDPAIQAMIRAAITEWERKYTPY
jgi:hypothetical protein